MWENCRDKLSRYPEAADMDGRVREALRILYPCPYCNSPVRDLSTSLVCDLCTGYTHLNCTDLPAEVSTLVQLQTRESSSIKFFCCNCISAANSLVERNRLNAEISKRYEMLQHSFLDFTSVVHNKLSSLELSVKSISDVLHSNESRRPLFTSGQHAADVTTTRSTTCDLISFDYHFPQNQFQQPVRAEFINNPPILPENPPQLGLTQLVQSLKAEVTHWTQVFTTAQKTKHAPTRRLTSSRKPLNRCKITFT